MCYTYDELSRVTSRTVKKLSDNSVVSTEAFNYDAAGNYTITYTDDDGNSLKNTIGLEKSFHHKYKSKSYDPIVVPIPIPIPITTPSEKTVTTVPNTSSCKPNGGVIIPKLFRAATSSPSPLFGGGGGGGALAAYALMGVSAMGFLMSRSSALE